MRFNYKQSGVVSYHGYTALRCLIQNFQISFMLKIQKNAQNFMRRHFAIKSANRLDKEDRILYNGHMQRESMETIGFPGGGDRRFEGI